MRLSIARIFIYLFLILGFIYPNNCVSQNIEPIPKIDSKSIYVYDYESILSEKEKKILEDRILKFENETQKEILIVTTHSIGPIKDIQEYATYLRSVYCSNTKNENVVIVAISKTLKEIGISMSNKPREVLTDEICTGIINQKMIPEFKKGNFFYGIKQGLDGLIEVWGK